MPVVRCLYALLLTGLQVALLTAVFRHLPSEPGKGAQLMNAAMHIFIPTAGAIIASLGAWSNRGSRGRLFDRAVEAALTNLTLVLATVAAGAGLVAAFADKLPPALSNSIHGTGISLAIQLPVLAALVVAFALRRADRLRPATFILAVGAALALIAHLLGSVSQGLWSDLTHACLLGAIAIGLATVAATAEASHHK
jgi:cytochrome bd-type quinol oxidase subunit 2